MNHTTEIIKHEQPNDECIAVTIRCCGDLKTDSTTTINAAHTLTLEQIEIEVEKYHDRVAQKHESMTAGRKHLDGLRGRIKQHLEK
jgi:hypothetical protein